MLSMWPKEEKLKQFANRVIRKIKRDRLNRSLAKVHVAGIVKLLIFEERTAKIYLPTEDTGLSRQLHFSSIREWRSTKYLIDLLSQRNYGHIVDLGANLGYFVLIESLFSKAKITAIEPVKFNFDILSLNLSLNHLQDIDVRNVAVGNANSNVTIYEFGQKNWSTVDVGHAELLKSQGYTATKQQVKQIMLDDLLGEFSDEQSAGLIRMDVEGFEFEILTASSLLETRNYDLFIEFHSNILGKSRSLTLLKHLKKCGYSDAVIVFNEEFSKDEQVLDYNDDRRVQDLSLDVLISNFDIVTDQFVKENCGFELFLCKA